MSAAGLITEYLFRGARLVPTSRPLQVVEPVFHWNYTAALNGAFLLVFAGILYLYTNRERLGGGIGYALDPVCGMQVETAHAPARAEHNGRVYHFCSDGCRDRFVASPERFTTATSRDRGGDAASPTAMEKVAPGAETDPVCGMTVAPSTAAARSVHEGLTHHFCSAGCAAAFAEDPERYAAPARAEQTGDARAGRHDHPTSVP